MSRRLKRGLGVAPLDFFVDHSVFTLKEYLAITGRTDAAAASAQLSHHVKVGNLFRLKRGLYQYADDFDPTAVAARWLPDAVLAYDSAFLIHTAQRDLLRIEHASTITRHRCRGTDEIEVVRRPALAWIETRHRGAPCRVTPREHTVVDLLQRPDLAPPAEVLWRYVASNPLNTDMMIAHARKLGTQVLHARLGALLEHLPWTRSLEGLDRPRRPNCAWNRDWNLMIPLRLWQLATRTDFRCHPPRFPGDHELAE